MATFKAVVQRHQQREDGKYPVSIRITSNRKSCYIPTGLYCSPAQISKKTFEIKDQFIIARTNKTISEWERLVLFSGCAHFDEMSAKELKKLFSIPQNGIDMVEEITRINSINPLKRRKLASLLSLLRKMGITELKTSEFTSNFLYKFKEFLDKRSIPITKNCIIVGYKHYAQNTKRDYVSMLCQVFRELQRRYNTEFNAVISHNPFINFDNYKVAMTAKRSLSADRVKAFFDLPVGIRSRRETIDLMKLSFCLCGINLIDIFAMEKSAWDERAKRITYARHKTKDRSLSHSIVSVRVEPEIYDIIERYKAPEDSPLLFNFKGMKADYKSTHKICKRVVKLCEKYGFEPITPYWFRHSWATIAYNDCDVSKDDIDLCLGHSGRNTMADVYIRPNWSRVDNANRKVLDFVFGDPEKYPQKQLSLI